MNTLQVLEDTKNQLKNSMYYVRSNNSDIRYYNEHLQNRLNSIKEGSSSYNISDLDMLKDRIKSYKDNKVKHLKSVFMYNRKLNYLKMLTSTMNSVLDQNTDIEKTGLSYENDFDFADYILESGEITSGYSSERIFSRRVAHNFNGTYKVKIQRLADYEKFINMLADDMIILDFKENLSVSFDEWKNGYILDDKNRQSKINKYLRKKGFSQYTIDFYSQQVKTEKELFLSFSDKVQDIAGMSYFSNMKWDGMEGSSCQNPEVGYSECNRLLASLHDNTLLVAFLHENEDDIENMRERGESAGKALGRTVLRLINVNDTQYLIGTRLYGNNETKSLLEKGIQALNGHNIFSTNQMDTKESTIHREYTNGYFYLNQNEEINICETIDEYVDCECPMCGGGGDITRYNSHDREIEIQCPACRGEGKIETHVYIDIDEYVELDDDEELVPYDESYDHHGTSMTIYIDKKVLGINN